MSRSTRPCSWPPGTAETYLSDSSADYKCIDLLTYLLTTAFLTQLVLSLLYITNWNPCVCLCMSLCVCMCVNQDGTNGNWCIYSLVILHGDLDTDLCSNAGTNYESCVTLKLPYRTASCNLHAVDGILQLLQLMCRWQGLQLHVRQTQFFLVKLFLQCHHGRLGAAICRQTTTTHSY